MECLNRAYLHPGSLQAHTAGHLWQRNTNKTCDGRHMGHAHSSMSRTSREQLVLTNFVFAFK